MSLNNGQRFIFKAIKSQRIKADTFIRYLFASQFTDDKTVLDAACGIGFGTFFIAQEARQVQGIDFFEEAINYAQKNYSRGNIKFETGDLLEYKLPHNFFDIIISFHTLEQTDNPKKLLDNFSQALKMGGLLILSTPNKKIVSPFSQKTAGKFNQYEFYKKELDAMFKKDFQASWHGQRCVFKPLANYFIRRFVRLLEILSNKQFGFYGQRESPEVLPLTWWRQPKDFVVLLTKIN